MVFYCRLYVKELVDNEAAICLSMRAVLVILFLYGCGLAYQKKLTLQRLTWLLILGGLVMRIGYTYYTPYYVRLFDLGEISESGNGHAAYIYNLFYHHTLPASYNYQFYHPPLYHILAALNMKPFSVLYPTADPVVWLEAAKLISCYVYLAAFWQQLRDYVKTSQKGMLHLLANCLICVIPVLRAMFALLSAYMFSNLS